VPTGEEEVIECDLVLRSIGYRGESLCTVPFDDSRGLVRNDGGRVLDDDGNHHAGEYVAGWIKRGPSGVIGTNKKDAADTVARMLEDREAGTLNAPADADPDACAEWLAAGLRVPVAVNVTPQDLADPTLPDCVQSLLDGHQISGDLLILEITESAVLQDIEGTSAVIERLRRLGVALSIDDFGVGYSSMSRLVQLQLAELKVDMSLVLGLHVSAEAAAVVKAVIDLGHALGMRVVAEAEWPGVDGLVLAVSSWNRQI